MAEFIVSVVKQEDIDEIERTYACQKIIRCERCCHWKPEHIKLNDGRQRLYREGEKESCPLGIGVTSDVGINIGSACWREQNTGYGRNMRVFRKADDYCSRAEELPKGRTPEDWWGLSTEPSVLMDDFGDD